MTDTSQLTVQVQRTLWSRRRLLTKAALIGAPIAVLMAMSIDPWYETTLTVMPTMQSPMSMQNALAGAAAAELPIDLGGVSSDSEKVAAMFRSVGVADAVIAKFNLKSRYELKYTEDTRRALWAHCSLQTEKKSTFVKVTCEDRDPVVARDMTAYFGVVTKETFRRVSGSSAGEERRFLETRVKEARHDVDEAARHMLAFQQEHKVIDIPEQTKQVVGTLGTLRTQIMMLEFELSYLSSFASQQAEGVQQKRRMLASMQEKLRTIAGSVEEPEPEPADVAKRPRKSADETLPRLFAVPKLRFEFEALAREQKIQETVFALLVQRFEMAKVNEARDTSAFQLVDAPWLPTKKSRPSRALQSISMLALWMGLTVGYLLAKEWWRLRKGTA